VLGLVFVVSLMLEIIPGDPVLLMLSETASREMKEAVRHQLGLDKPFMQRYFNYLGKIMQGDLGRSFLKGQKVAKLVGNAFPATAELAAASLFVMMLVGLPIGVLSALFPQSKVDCDFKPVFDIRRGIADYARWYTEYETGRVSPGVRTVKEER